MSSRRAQFARLAGFGVLLLAASSAGQGKQGSAAKPNAAHAKTLEGRWRASSMIVQWAIGEWGPACGPEPSTAGEPGGTAIISSRGAELQIAGPGRSFSTASCWEQYPGLSRVGHSAGSRRWSSVCKTAASDPRRATIRTTINATDNALHFDETGQYQFLIEGQNCTASSRRTRTYTLIQRAGEAPKEDSPQKKPAPGGGAPSDISKGRTPVPGQDVSVPKEGKTAKCRVLGSPQRLEVQPARKLMRSGESFTFRSSVRDSKGCRLSPSLVKWRLANENAFASVDKAGTIEIAQNAPDGQLTLIAEVGPRELSLVVDVVSQETYDQLLSGGDFTLSGESKDGSTLALNSASISKSTAVAEDTATTRKMWFVALSASMALLLGALGVALLRQGKNPNPAATGQKGRYRPAEKRRTPAEKLSPIAGNQPKVCPACGTMYTGDSQFCGRDGTALVAANRRYES